VKFPNKKKKKKPPIHSEDIARAKTFGFFTQSKQTNISTKQAPHKRHLSLFPNTNNAKDFIVMLCGSYGPNLTDLQGQCWTKATVSIITLVTM
jgi:hypothetical protein